MKNVFFVLLSILLLTCADAQDISVIRYEGSSTIAHFIKDAENTYQSAKFLINSDSESSGGEKAILEGTADIAGVARVPSANVLGKGVTSTLIGWDAIAVVLHKSNPITNLTSEQLKGIFTNRITNWNELGGPDLEINAYIVDDQSATRKVFRAAIMDKHDYTNCKTIKPDSDILNNVANDIGGIGQISFSFLSLKNDQIKIISVDGQEASVTNQSYPITRPLYLLWWPGRESTSSFAKWTQTKQAQELITRRFIGSVQQTVGKRGKLMVFTNTYAVEEGGAYYYPHESYDIFTADGRLLKHVTNHLEPTDENPSIVDLPPGQYLLLTETSKKTDGEKILVTIEAGETTRIEINKSERLLQLTDKAKPILSDNLRMYGDFRFRGENDWNSRRSDGSYRDDRFRLRYRLRFGFNYKLNEQIAFGGRLRSGNTQNPQSPHITLGERLPDDGVSIDKAFLKVNTKNWWAWMGKNNFPFWKQNEMYWDDDVIPEGIAFGGRILLTESITLKPITGYFTLHDPAQNLSLDPSMLAGQLTLNIENRESELTLSSGYFNLTKISDLGFQEVNHTLDYGMLISSAMVNFKYKTPITLGVDYITNLTDYSNDSLVTFSGHKNQKTGFVGSIQLGSLSDKNKWLLAYYYSYIQKYSVVPFLAQDDYVRWDYGNIAASRSSNFKGHEVRLAYAFEKGFNVVARAYFVDGILKRKPNDADIETSHRIRLDLNLNF